jgi:hypothetical protein
MADDLTSYGRVIPALLLAVAGCLWRTGFFFEELFERERGSDPDFQVWEECALACDIIEA